MKKTLSFLVLLTVGLSWAWAEDTTTLQVAPSDQVIYPDASQILNKTEPKPQVKPTSPVPATSTAPAAIASLPSAKPLIASTPIPAKPAAPAVKPATKPTQGWYLRWVVSAANEAAAREWAVPLGEVQVSAAGEGLWEVVSGPLAAANLKAALNGQGGQATLVKR